MLFFRHVPPRTFGVLRPENHRLRDLTGAPPFCGTFHPPFFFFFGDGRCFFASLRWMSILYLTFPQFGLDYIQSPLPRRVCFFFFQPILLLWFLFGQSFFPSHVFSLFLCFLDPIRGKKWHGFRYYYWEGSG